MRRLSLFFALPFLVISTLNACTTESSVPADVPEGSTDLRIALAPPGYGYQITSTPHVVKAGTESTRCDVVRIDPIGDEKLVWLDQFESITSKHTHHMNVHVGAYSVADAYIGKGAGAALLGVDEGSYDCDELGDIMEQGSYPVYPSQNTHQTAVMPKGIAIPGIVPLLMIIEHHFINTGEEDVYINAAVNFHRVDESEVEHVLTGFYGIGKDIDLPGNSEKIEAWTCKLNREINMVAISSHAHERQKCFTMNQYEKETSTVSDEPFFVNPSWDQPPIIFYERDEWTLREGDGVHWACHYRNPEDRMVVGGPSATDEMCIFVGVGYPNNLSVQDIKNLAADPLSYDLDSLVDDALINCELIPVESPWPVTDQVLEEPIEQCGGFEPTLE